MQATVSGEGEGDSSRRIVVSEFRPVSEVDFAGSIEESPRAFTSGELATAWYAPRICENLNCPLVNRV